MAKILIVEDDANQRLLYREEFEDEGYQVAVAADGAEALSGIEKDPPDVIVLDISMPGLSGLDMLGRIHDLNPGIPIVLNTAYAAYKNQFVSWIADAYIVKSSNLEDLKRAVQTALEKRSRKASE